MAEPDYVLYAAVEPPASAAPTVQLERPPGVAPVPISSGAGRRLVAAAQPQALLPNDEQWPKLWHLPMVRAPQAWETTTGSSAAAVCVVDSVRACGCLLALLLSVLVWQGRPPGRHERLMHAGRQRQPC